jgi:myo-inositol-1(or 4)-monophosphatase
VRAVLADAEDLRRTGSAALDLAYVAAGRLDGFWEMGLGPWDMAAGALLVREAGGICRDHEGEEEFLSRGSIVAGNVRVCAQLLGRIKAKTGKPTEAES